MAILTIDNGMMEMMKNKNGIVLSTYQKLEIYGRIGRRK